MRFPIIKNGTHETIDKFFWWPTKAWDTEAQAHVTLWLERVRVIRCYLGGRWGHYVIECGHDEQEEEMSFSPEARRVFRELGIR